MSRQETIDQRLDALDRALLGLLPRSERLEFVASLQARLEAQPAESLTANDAAPCEPAAAASNIPRRRRRSAVALTAGVLGIVALAMLFALPVTYLIVAAASEALGELITYTLLSANVLIVALGGGAAVVLGIVALVRLARQRGQFGHGWAITGLCTGPLPALAGGLGMITFVFPLMAELANSGVSTVPCATGTCYVPAPSDASLVGMPVQMVSNSPYASASAQPWSPAPLPPISAPRYEAAPNISAPTAVPASLPPASSDAPATPPQGTLPSEAASASAPSLEKPVEAPR